MFQEVKETMLKELKENIVIMTQQIEILNKEIFFKKIETLEVKSNCWNEKFSKGIGFNSRFEMAEKRVHRLQDSSKEII